MNCKAAACKGITLHGKECLTAVCSAQEEQLEAAALRDEMDQNEADLAAIHKILSSPFVQRDAMRERESGKH